MDLLIALALPVVLNADPVPEPEDVRAGWTGFWIVMGMIVATGLLLWSLTRQLRHTRDNAARGVFGDGRRPAGSGRGADAADGSAEADEGDDPARGGAGAAQGS